MAEGVSGLAAPGSPGIDKPIYTLSVAAEILATHPRTLMMYETVGLITPHRTSTNRRRYTQRDVSKLQAVQNLTRRHGVNLAGVRHLLKLLVLLREHQVKPPEELSSVDVSMLEAAG